MELDRFYENNSLIVKVTGQVDSLTAPALEEELGKISAGKELVLDLGGVSYMASAGLRVLLLAQRKWAGLKVRGVGAELRELFDMTGFSDVLDLI